MASVMEPTVAAVDDVNPMGTDGFEVVEFAAPDPAALEGLFTRLGFTAVARHRRRDVVLYRQGEINFLLNREPGSFAADFAAKHGPSGTSIGTCRQRPRFVHSSCVHTTWSSQSAAVVQPAVAVLATSVARPHATPSVTIHRR